MNKKTSWSIKRFDELSLVELYEIIKLRIAVFVVEQNCPFQDCDDKDQVAFHLMGWQGTNLVAYTRLLAPGISYQQMSIGRVVTSSVVRGTGIGKELMTESIIKVQQLFGYGEIQIGAQLYLERFYNSFGFKQIGESYLEDGIPHIHMLLK